MRFSQGKLFLISLIAMVIRYTRLQESQEITGFFYGKV